MSPLRVIFGVAVQPGSAMIVSKEPCATLALYGTSTAPSTMGNGSGATPSSRIIGVGGVSSNGPRVGGGGGRMASVIPKSDLLYSVNDTRVHNGEEADAVIRELVHQALRNHEALNAGRVGVGAGFGSNIGGRLYSSSSSAGTYPGVRSGSYIGSSSTSTSSGTGSSSGSSSGQVAVRIKLGFVYPR